MGLKKKKKRKRKKKRRRKKRNKLINYLIDQLIFDQLSPTLTKPKRLTKSSPPLYHQKSSEESKKPKPRIKIQRKKKHTIFSYFPPCMINVLVFFEDIYTHETKLLVFFRYFVTIV